MSWNEPEDTLGVRAMALQVIGSGFRFPNKPDPGAALHLAERMQAPPGRVAYAGDSATDMETAAAAGMFPVGVAWGFRPESELLAAGCRFLARRPMDIVQLVDSEG